MPAGTLKKVGGSPPIQTGREKVGGGWVLGGGGWRYLPWKPRTAPAWPVSATTARTSGRGEGRGRGADQAERSQVPAGSSASVSRSEAGVGVGESGMSEGLRFWLRDPGRERGGVRQAVRGPGQGIVGVGCLGWAAWGGVGGLRGQRVADKAAAPPRSATQSNEWAINSGQWAACVAPLKSRGSAEPPLFACAAP